MLIKALSELISNSYVLIYIYIYICNVPAILLATGDAGRNKRDTIPLLMVIRFKRGRQKLSKLCLT